MTRNQSIGVACVWIPSPFRKPPHHHLKRRVRDTCQSPRWVASCQIFCNHGSGTTTRIYVILPPDGTCSSPATTSPWRIAVRFVPARCSDRLVAMDRIKTYRSAARHRHRLGVASLALDTSDSAYRPGCSGRHSVFRWQRWNGDFVDLGMPMKKRKLKQDAGNFHRGDGRWELMTGWGDDCYCGGS